MWTSMSNSNKTGGTASLWWFTQTWETDLSQVLWNRDVASFRQALFAPCLLGPSQFDWSNGQYFLPSGYLTVRHGKSHFFIGKPSINGPFSMAMFMLNNQRVTNRYLDLKRTNNMLDKLCCHWDKLPLGFLVGQNSGDILRIQPTDLIWYPLVI